MHCNKELSQGPAKKESHIHCSYDGKAFPARKKMGRQRTLNERDERNILRQIEAFRRGDNPRRFSFDQVRKAAGFDTVPLYTIQQVLLRQDLPIDKQGRRGC